jgi:pimeloyl-ACP methyl ester carboxylesterase
LSDTPHLPAPAGGWLFRGPPAALWLRPWFDRLALAAVARWYLPLSRAWAAAVAAEGDPARFWAELPGEPARVPGIEAALALVERRRGQHLEREREWEAAFFGADAPSDAALVAAEHRRRRRAERLMLTRGAFAPLAALGRAPQAKWALDDEAALSARHGHRLAGAAAAFPAPEAPEMRRSAIVPGPHGARFWLRYPAPSPEMGEAWAHVHAPTGVADPPTVVFLHGICVEAEYWSEGWDPLPGLAARGLRVVRLEGPWHGRRRLAGHYGGEPALARGPGGFLALFEAWVAEAAATIAWARRTSAGPVALGGISLGALTSQLAAVAAHHWPDEMRPDVLMLVATTGDVAATLASGGLGKSLDMRSRLERAGWSEETIAPWMALAEPQGEPALPPERIIMALGDRDRVTPYAGGLALAERWRIPPQNRFIRPRGHFSTSLAIAERGGPLERLVEVLGEIGAG